MSGALQEAAHKPALPDLLPRTELLAAMRSAIACKGRLALIDVQPGALGNGKSVMARAFTRAYASHYKRVVWLRANEPAVFTAEFAELAFAVGHVEPGVHTKAALIDTVRCWMQKEDAWLLVADGVSDPEILGRYLEGIGTGHVLVTGRTCDYPSTFETLHVPGFEESEIVKYLDDGTGEIGRLNGHGAALALLRAPVMARLGIAYREQFGGTLLDLAQILRSGDPAGATPLAHLIGALLGRLQSQDPAAFQLALMCAHLDATLISPLFLLNGRTFLPTELSEALSNIERVRLALGRLATLGLLRPTHNGAAMPSSIRQAMLAYVPEPEKHEWARRAVRLASDAFPHEDQYQGYLASCSRLLGVTLSTTGRCIELGCELDTVGALLNRVGQYLHGFGDSEAARQCLTRSARIAALQHGYQSPILALRLNNLGAAELAADNPELAKEHFERALTIVRTCENDHRALMSEILRNLANAHLASDDLDAARIWLKEALTRHRHFYGRNHRYVVECLNQLGVVFARSGRAEQSLKSFHHAVNVAREIPSLDPKQLASCLSNLGDALRKEGDLERSESCLDEALALYKSTGDVNDGQVAKLLIRSGRTKRRRKRFDEAAALFEEAYALGLEYDAETTPATFARQIGRTHALDGNLYAAVKWYRKARTLYEAQGDVRDADFIRLLVEMAEVLLKQNEEAEAESVFRQALALRESGVACPDHYSARMHSGIGEIEERRSNLEEAAQCYGRARVIYRNIHGEDHPDVARQMTHMGRCLYRMGRGFEAVANIVYAERILSERLGSNHRDTRRAHALLEQLRE